MLFVRHVRLIQFSSMPDIQSQSQTRGRLARRLVLTRGLVVADYLPTHLQPKVALKILCDVKITGKGNKGRHKRQRQRLTSDEDKQEEEEEFYNGEEYSYEYEDELSPDDHLASQEGRDNRQEEQLPTHNPTQLETLAGTSSYPLTSSTDRQTDEQEEQLLTHTPAQLETRMDPSSHPLIYSTDRETDEQVALTTTEPLSQPMTDREKDEVSLPSPAVTTEEPDKDVS